MSTKEAIGLFDTIEKKQAAAAAAAALEAAAAEAAAATPKIAMPRKPAGPTPLVPVLTGT
jgi:hypothetical protein